MTIRNIRLSAMALGAAAALVSTSAHAVWTFDTTGNNGTTSNNGTYSYVGAAGDPSVSLSGVYATNNASGVVTGNWSNATTASGSASPVSFGNYGIGMQSDGATVPNHALDNVGNTEAILLSFGSSTVLSSIGLGYTSRGVCASTTSSSSYSLGNNASCATGYSLVAEGPTTTTPKIKVDTSVFRWTGTSAPPTLAGVNATTMTGWELVGNYGDMVVDTTNPYNLVNSSKKASSWWLISAYNSGFAQTSNSASSIATENRNIGTTGSDYFKLYAVAGTKCTGTVGANGVCGGTSTKVPEPASLALASVALVGVVGLRRRKARLAA